MDTYEFIGEWDFNLKLPNLSNIHSAYWLKFRHNKDFQNLLNEGYVPIQIYSGRNYNPDPNPSQTNAIKYLIENEIQILESIYIIINEIINPQYVKWYGDDISLPELHSVADLGKVIRIKLIHITPYQKDDISYIRIDFEYRGDGHGLAIILHKNKLTGFSTKESVGYECIYKDSGFDKSKMFAQQLEQNLIGENEVHLPIPKYGKYKQWQWEATSNYFNELLRAKENEIIIQEIESKKWNINFKFYERGRNLVDAAASANNIEMLEYLIEKGGDHSNSILGCLNNGGRKNQDVIKYLISKGANIDQLGHNNTTALCEQLKFFIKSLVKMEQYRDKDQKPFEVWLKEYNKRKDIIEFYIEQGANPNKLDDKGLSFIDIVNRSWSKNILDKHNVLQQVENLLFSHKPKNKKRKF